MAAKSTTTAPSMRIQPELHRYRANRPFASPATNADTYNKKSTVTVYDSQGNAHDMNLLLRQNGRQQLDGARD